MSSTIYAVSSDCPNIIELARGLGMQTASPSTWTALQGDCCTVSGIACDGSQRVWQINWNNMGLIGAINGTAIPSNVTYLSLYRNAITGSIPNALPSGLFRLDLSSNQMSGDIPSFPSTLQQLYLGNNYFTGTLRINRPIYLYINDNWITDLLIQNIVALTSGCELSNNPLLGNPNIAGLTMCAKTGLYSAALLPVTRSTTTVAKTTTTSAVITTSVLETTDGASTTKMTKNTPLENDTAHQIWSNEMSVTGRITDISISSIWTVQFGKEMSGFSVNLGMMMRIVISAMLLTYVMTRTPFKREFKKMMDKRKTTTTTSALEF